MNSEPCVRAVVVALCAGQGVGVAGALGQVRLETVDMPYKAAGTVRTSRPPVFLPAGIDNLQAQVNVNGQGLNIVGDAANEPSMAVDPTAPNRIAIGWRQFDTVASNFRQAGRAYSKDGGRHWTFPGVLEPGVFRSDPVLRADKNGVMYYLSLTNTGPGLGYSCQTFKSTDGGVTYGPAVQATGGDKSWLAIDTTNSSGSGFLYQPWSLGGVASQAFSRSIDGGATWLNPPVTPVPVWGTLAVNNLGDLYIGGIAGSAFACAKSTNARNGVVTPTFTTTSMPMGGIIVFGANPGPNPDGLLGQANLDVDRSGGPRDGWVYMLSSVDPPGADPCDVYFQRSTDGGQTWLASPIRVNSDPVGANGWQWFGTMSVSPNGRIDAVWNDTRESQNLAISRLYYAFSNDGGTTWQGNTAIGPSFNSTVGWPQQNKIGDYSDMVSDRVGAFLAYAATYNNEQDVYFLRINDYDCNNNGIPDATDLSTGLLHDCNSNGVPDECELAAGVPVICDPVCYANCDRSTVVPFLNINDFSCFTNQYAAGNSYANCDASTLPPVLNVNDFNCFLNRYAIGCSAP